MDGSREWGEPDNRFILSCCCCCSCSGSRLLVQFYTHIHRSQLLYGTGTQVQAPVARWRYGSYLEAEGEFSSRHPTASECATRVCTSCYCLCVSGFQVTSHGCRRCELSTVTTSTPRVGILPAGTRPTRGGWRAPVGTGGAGPRGTGTRDRYRCGPSFCGPSFCGPLPSHSHLLSLGGGALPAAEVLRALGPAELRA